MEEILKIIKRSDYDVIEKLGQTPYPSILPVIIEPVKEGDVPYTILHPDMPTSLEDLQRDWIQIKREHDTFEAQFYTSEKKVLELTYQLHEEKTLNTYIAPKRMHNVFLP